MRRNITLAISIVNTFTMYLICLLSWLQNECEMRHSHTSVTAWVDNTWTSTGSHTSQTTTEISYTTQNNDWHISYNTNDRDFFTHLCNFSTQVHNWASITQLKQTLQTVMNVIISVLWLSMYMWHTRYLHQAE